MNTRVLLPLMPLLLACTPAVIADGGGSTQDTTGDDSDPTTGDGDGDGDPTTGNGDGDGNLAEGDGGNLPPGDGGGDGDGDGDPDTGDGDGDEELTFCGLSEGPDEPWFQLYHNDEPLVDNSALHITCGFQGSFMFEVVPQLGGFIPDAAEVPFHATLDVEGFNVGFNDHFVDRDFDLYVACCENYCDYVDYSLQLIPPDQIPDISVVHEQPGQLTVTMEGPKGPVVQVVDVQLWAVGGNGEWSDCFYYDENPSEDPLPVNGLPIP